MQLGQLVFEKRLFFSNWITLSCVTLVTTILYLILPVHRTEITIAGYELPVRLENL